MGGLVERLGVGCLGLGGLLILGGVCFLRSRFMRSNSLVGVTVLVHL